MPIMLTSCATLCACECFGANTTKDLATEVREYFIPDVSSWDHDQPAYQKALDRLLRDLRTEGVVLSGDHT